MAWIESHQSLGEHPKTKKLCRILGISKAQAIGHLHMLWWWALDYAQDGSLARYDDLDIAIGAEWEGDQSGFVTALESSGFLDSDRRIHDWHDYAGKLIERRERNAQRMRDARANDDSDTDGTRAAHVQRTQRARVQLQNQPNQPNHTGGTPPVVPQSPPVPPAPPPPKEPKPRTERQKAADELYERKMVIVAAYFRGLSIEEGTLPWTQRKGSALSAITTAVLNSPECVPEIVEPLTRYTAAAFQWRHGKKTPALNEVLMAFAEWDQAGRPESIQRPPMPINGRASPLNRPSKNGRIGYTADELEAMARGESVEPPGHRETAIDSVFRVVR